MHLFYAPDITTPEYTLNEEESKHSIRVLRLTIGDIIYLVDGKGGFYATEISSISAKSCTVKIIEQQYDYGKRDYRLHIAIAPTKNIDRFEWFLEKATEIGIDEITPLLCEHSERKVIKLERLQKVVEAAMKQSLKAYYPRVNNLATFEQVIKVSQANEKLIAHCYDTPKQLLKNAIKPQQDIIILVGPEGDFSPKEVELAKQVGFKNISLGNSRLRTETAGIVACCTVWIGNQT
ncbi:MAG: 16S rRNA (uracil(1498)-N(3))-methyltransferase [Prevotellaceae bacterium]|jgi:16S rRNA (uracil1498-N3)-methyltransferase|nr:16S rRNA (uracil(1498)-N(3))-methyltransferase [Prevotellaceae bacterium]